MRDMGKKEIVERMRSEMKGNGLGWAGMGEGGRDC